MKHGTHNQKWMFVYIYIIHSNFPDFADSGFGFAYFPSVLQLNPIHYLYELPSKKYVSKLNAYVRK